ncbi:MAG: extracellular solute-binding protein [Thermomicrobiales bacterium]|nr:extracellular solute-binding protein [Thermomicrobiales bacterium]
MPERNRPHRLTRRTFAVGAAASATLAALTACVENSDSQSTPTATVPSTSVAEPTPTQGTIASPVPAYEDATKWLGRTLSIATWGGDFESAQGEAFFRPFEAQTGAQIQTKNADIARMIDQVDTNAVTWDLMTIEMGRVLSLAREGYLTPIDYNIVDKTPLIPEFALQHGVGMACYSTVIVYSPALVAQPATWSDFWNVSPPVEGEASDPAQVRTLPHTAVGTLEFALLADGVSVDDLYPLDVERAFANLNRIYPNVPVWYEDGKLPIEMTIAGQAGMAAGWNVRVDQFGEDEAIDMIWDGGMIAGDAWVIPAGAPNADVAMDFVNFATRAIPSANFSRLVPYGPVNLNSFPLIREDHHPLLPTSPENLDVQFIQNWNWWSDNLEEVQARFNQWIIDGPPPAE